MSGCSGSLLVCMAFPWLWRAGVTLVAVPGFSVRWLLLLSTGSKALGLQLLQLVGSREQAQ